MKTKGRRQSKNVEVRTQSSGKTQRNVYDYPGIEARVSSAHNSKMAKKAGYDSKAWYKGSR